MTTTLTILDEIKNHINGLGDNPMLFIETKETFSVTNGEFSIKHEGNFVPKKVIDFESIIPANVLERGSDLRITVEKTVDSLKVFLFESSFSVVFEYQLKISLA